MGLIAFIKRLFHIRSKVSQNKTEQIKCNDINKNSILPPNNVVPQNQLCLVQSGCRATHKRKQRCLLHCNIIYNSFERGSANQNQGTELSTL